MAETKRMAEEMSEAAMRRVEESKNKWAGRWEHSAYLCADRIQEREWMFGKLKALNSRVQDLTMRTKTTEEKVKENRGQQR